MGKDRKAVIVRQDAARLHIHGAAACFSASKMRVGLRLDGASGEVRASRRSKGEVWPANEVAWRLDVGGLLGGGGLLDGAAPLSAVWPPLDLLPTCMSLCRLGDLRSGVEGCSGWDVEVAAKVGRWACRRRALGFLFGCWDRSAAQERLHAPRRRATLGLSPNVMERRAIFMARMLQPRISSVRKLNFLPDRSRSPP